MRRRIRPHLTYANVISTLALFLVLGGGTALAAYVVSSNSQIGPNTVSGHKPPAGYHANIVAGSINGQDIADRSGVDTCKTPLTAKFGPTCAGSDGVARNWSAALAYCNGLGLRLPSFSEARALGVNYDVPGVSGSQYFWTDELTTETNVAAVNETGGGTISVGSSTNQTVCVTDPSA